MTDDLAARVAQLEGELAAARAREAASVNENARLIAALQERDRELREARAQQTALGDVLRAIASTPGDLGRVLDELGEAAMRQSRSAGCVMNLREGAVSRIVSVAGIQARDPQPQVGETNPVTMSRPGGRAMLEGRTIHIPDWTAPSAHAAFPDLSNVSLPVATLSVPLMRNGEAIGVFHVSRNDRQAYSQREIALVEAFADQAVIAIENARLFEALQERTADLMRALDRQTALGEVLRVIASSPADLTNVLDAIASAAGRFTSSDNAMVQQVAGELLVPTGRYGQSAEAVREGRPRMHDTPITRGTMSGRTLLDRRTIHVADVRAAVETEYPDSREPHLRMGQRSQVSTPLLREGEQIGVLVVQRQRQQPFTEQEIGLLEAFADQAVIAIENARLFTELEQRNRDLGEALEQQTAMGEVLRVIASSPTDLEAALQTILETAARLCGASGGGALHQIRPRDGRLSPRVSCGELRARMKERYDDPFNEGPGVPPSRDAVSGRAFVDAQTVNGHDFAA